ncbi:hypothetical protein Bca4012_065846 [Brassica carinata]
MSLDVNRALSVGLGGSTDSIGESGGWMVWKGMHTHQFLQQRTGLTTKQRETLLLDIYKAQMQFCEDSNLMKVFLEVVRSLYEVLAALMDGKKWILIVVYWSLHKRTLRCLLCFFIRLKGQSYR